MRSPRSLRPTEIPPLVLHPHADLGEALEAALRAHASATVIIETDRHQELRRLTARDLHIRARLLARHFLDQGIGPQSRVGVLLHNGSAWPVVAIATFLVRATLVPLDPKLEPGEWRALLAHCRVDCLAMEGSLLRRAQRDALDLPPLLVLDPLSPLSPDDLDLASILDTAATQLPTMALPPAAERNATAAIVYTSGTSGSPKGCCLTHDNYLRQAESLSKLFPFGREDRFFSFLPTHHAIDFMCGLLIPVLSGGTTLYQRTLRPELLAWTLRRYRPTHLAAVPRVLELFADTLAERLAALSLPRRAAIEALMEVNAQLTAGTPQPAWSQTLLAPILEGFGGRLRLIVAGGAPVPPAIATSLMRAGIPVAVGYGLTEAGTVLTVNRLDPFRADSVGPPVPGVELQIREPNADGIGEVIARGPTVMAGYLEDPETTQARLQGGWLHTGDLGRIDETGHLRLHGRAREMVVTPGGKNLYPEDLELHFHGIPGCEEFAILPTVRVWPLTPQPETLLLVVRPTGKEDPIQLQERMLARNRTLPAARRAHGVLVVTPAFPRTASLKLKRTALAESVGTEHTEADALWLNAGSRERAQEGR